MSTDTVSALFSNPENHAIYQEWISNPLTQRLLALARTATRPVGLANPEPNAALYYLGVQVGMTSVLDFLENMEKVAQAIDSAEPEATFGAEEILKSMGYSKSK